VEESEAAAANFMDCPHFIRVFGSGTFAVK
jgi:hypothetical protein